MKVILRNAHTTSGGTGPGLVDVPAHEAHHLVQSRYAVRLAEEPKPEPKKALAKVTGGVIGHNLM